MLKKLQKNKIYAKKIAKKQDIIVITGSLFTVGEARDALVCNLQKC